MQARPLKTRPSIGYELKSFFYGLSDIFGYKAGYDKPLCDDPVQMAYDYKPLFQLIGFDQSPVDIKRKRKVFSSDKAEEGQDTKFFLQWGVEVMHTGHVVFEIADRYTRVRIDFRENWPHEDEQTYQIDDIRIYGGATEYQIDCESFDQKRLMSDTLICVAETVSWLNQKSYSVAETEFENMSRVIDNINQVSDGMNDCCALLASGVQKYGKTP